MAHDDIVSLLVARCLSERARASTGPSGRSPEEHRDLTRYAVRRAVRHAWLALETALAGPSVWERIAGSLPPAQGSVFLQQMDALLDHLSLAGLESEGPGSRRRCREELRSARRAGLLAAESQESAPAEPGASPLNGTAGGHETEWHAIRALEREFGQAGYPQLAAFAGLSAPWDEPLLLGVVVYFVGRALQAHPLLAPYVAGRAASCWRCLETVGRLLDEDETALVEILDRAEEAGPAKGRDDGAVEKLFQLGLARFLHGDYRQAAAQFTAALRLDPTDARLYANRGDAYRLLCEYERAIADFEAALRLGPANPSAFVSRAIAYHFSGEHERAVADCTAALESSPNSATAYRIRAAALADLGANDLALADLTAAVGLAPEDDEARFQRGVILAGLRDYDRAIADFDRVLKLNSHHVPAYLHRGHAHRCRGDHAGAIRDYSEVLRHHPTNVLAYTGRGLAYRLAGDVDRALADYSEALRLEPENARAACSRGVLHRARGDLGLALADLDQAVRLEPDNWVALYHRSKVFLSQGRFDDALADLTAALSLNPKIVVAYLSRAVIQDRLARHREGLEDSTRAVELDASCPAAYVVRGVIYSHLGDHAAAVGDLSAAIRLDERFALAYHERGMAHTLRGGYDLALADCNRLIALEPGNAQAYANRSIVYHFKGQVPKALLDYTRAMQLDPRCIMTGWNQGLAENARLQTTQRLADYIDGLRSEPQATEAPPPPRFRIVLKPPESTASAPAPTEADGSAVHRAVEAPAADAETAAASATTEESTDRGTDAPARARPRTDGAGRGHGPTRRKMAPAGPALESRTETAEADGPSEAGANAEDQGDAAVDEVLLDPPEAPAAPAPAPDETAEHAAAAATATDRTTPKRVMCPVCRRETIPCETLPGGRVRCGTCRNMILPGLAPLVFGPAPATGTRPAPRRPTKKRAEGDDDRTFVQKWGKPGGAVGAAAALLLLLYFCFSAFGRSHQVRVYPAHGQVLFEGKPVPGASLTLDPVWTKEPDFPRPRAVTREDGTFMLETYGKEDGAPAGDYKVLVQCFVRRTKLEAEGSGLPSNALPGRYAKFDTSGLTLQVQEGDTEVPALKLKR
jgi:tetratricopeptide (TPR) repeat protein